jgi:hypothetical protein
VNYGHVIFAFRFYRGEIEMIRKSVRGKYVASMTALLALAAFASTAFAVCPSANGIANKATSAIVAASYTTVTSNGVSTVTYTFSGLDPANTSVNGVPGLITYCVYVGAANLPTGPIFANWDGSVGSLPAVGADNEAFGWDESSMGSFSFTRAHGNPSNISFDGAIYTMGTAAWNGTAPQIQTILLHINDPIECTKLYGTGGVALNTCWVFPGGSISPGE